MKGKRKKRPGCGDTTLLTEFDESSTMAYLHGDVADGERVAAYNYEYARESRFLRETASLHKQGVSLEEIGERSDQVSFLASPWLDTFTSKHFPETPWTHLPQEVREEIVLVYPDPAGSLMVDVRRLDGILDRMKELGVKARSQ